MSGSRRVLAVLVGVTILAVVLLALRRRPARVASR